MWLILWVSQFDVKVHRVYNVLPGTSELRVALKRGNKHVTSQVRSSGNGWVGQA